MLLVVGLGNPGARYADHRHNLGFMVLDQLGASFRKRFDGEASEGHLADRRCLYLKPATYMNESGRSVAQACRFYRIESKSVLVIHDEIDLPAGKIRIKQGGGDSGHRGVRSVADHLGRDFWRLRVGVGHPGHRDAVNPYVLNDFSKADQAWLAPCLEDIVGGLRLLATIDTPESTAVRDFMASLSGAPAGGR